MSQSNVPSVRVRTLNDQSIRSRRSYVLYWMIANRRSGWNFSLEYACEQARALGKPLVVFEGLRSNYRWASDRLHQFVIQGMLENNEAFRKTAATYVPYIEPQHGAGHGLLQQLASRAAIVVTDDFPCFFHPKMLRQVAKSIDTLLLAVDSNGLLPMRSVDRLFSRAFDFRRFIQREIRPHLAEVPSAVPTDQLTGNGKMDLTRTLRRWPSAEIEQCLSKDGLTELPINHTVSSVKAKGGSEAALKTWRSFARRRFDNYNECRNHPDENATSGISPYLHFGHLSAHQVFEDICRKSRWHPGQLGDKTDGRAQGWWGMDENREAFVDQLVTWRELGFNMCHRNPNYYRYSSLPEWAQRTLDDHSEDPRPYLYGDAAFENAETHDPIWNAAQRQLVREGVIHNYLRMLWGKKILEWSATPRDALRIMLELNNKYALDGRDPNSYSGIFWILGRYDRAWGPERKIFGKIRYMSSDNTKRKLRIQQYLERYGE